MFLLTDAIILCLISVYTSTQQLITQSLSAMKTIITTEDFLTLCVHLLVASTVTDV